MKRIQLRVAAAEAGQRLDKFIAARSGLSRGACRRAIEEGGVWLEGRRIRRLSMPVQADRLIEVVIDDRTPATSLEPVVIYEDRSLLAIDKPAGLPTQGTLASDRRSALGWAQESRGREVRTVHRLDAGTSGILILAKSADAATALAAQFKQGTVRKRYLAIGVGTLPAAAGSLNQRLRPSSRRGAFEVTTSGGVPATTDYRVLASRERLSLVEARPTTGRTHQIRVHLAAAGAPLLGDTRYGGPSAVVLDGVSLEATRPLLHAAEIAFQHPESGKELTLRAKLAEDFRTLLGKAGLEGS